ncbi:MAG: DUF1080 domain-containing protein [Bryobacteraceae bacterium]
MRLIRLLAPCAVLCLLSAAAFAQAPANAEEGFVPLFNGRDLAGWDGDPRIWKVENGEIIGSTEGVELKQNSFLISRRTYGDFILRLRVKLRNHNSGIQFRSEALPDWVVRGYQADMAEDNWWGCLYDEKGTRGVMVNGWKGKAENVVRRGDWNDYEIHAEGDRIRLRVNGLLTVDTRDSERLEGVLALQVHRGPPMEVRFRDIRIKSLQ